MSKQEYPTLEKILSQMNVLKNMVKIDSVSAIVDNCFGAVEKWARAYKDSLELELSNAKTIQEIEDISLNNLENMTKHLKSIKTMYLLLENIRDFRENHKQAIQKRHSLSLRERLQFDNNLIQNLT